MKTLKRSAAMAAMLIGALLNAQHEYDISIREDNKLHVEAEIYLTDSTMFMPTTGIETLPEGPAGLVSNLKILSMDGREIKIADTKNHGNYFSWVLDGGNDRLRLSYDIEMTHDEHIWPFGVEEISHRTEEGYMIVGRYLFIVPNWSEKDRYEISFELPDDWSVSTPWLTELPGHYKDLSGSELRDNVIFMGSHQEEKVVIGDTELRLVLGPSLQEDKSTILTYLNPNMKAIGELFGAAPRGSYLVVMQEGPVAGGAFNQSYSMMIERPVNRNSSALWGHGMIHETFHLWNGRGLVPAEQMEWFKEGLTEYLSIRIQADTGSLPLKIIEKKLETAYRRYFLSTVMGPPVSLQEAGNNKHQNRMKIYGLGTIYALILDIEIRYTSSNEKRLEDVLKLMYQEMALQGKQYTLDDVIGYVNRVAGKDLKYLFDAYVTGTQKLEINKFLAKGGMVLNTFYDEAYLARLERAEDLSHRIGKEILGL